MSKLTGKWKQLSSDGRYKKQCRILVFLCRLLLLSIPLYIVIYFVNLFPLQLVVASQSAFLLRTFGFAVIQDGALLSVGAENPFQFFISEDSTGWKSFLFLAALIIAVPSVRWKKRAFGIIAGVPVLYIGNLLRVLTIVFSERAYGFETAMLIHDWLWEFGLTVLVLVLWVVWLKYANIIKKPYKYDYEEGFG